MNPSQLNISRLLERFCCANSLLKHVTSVSNVDDLVQHISPCFTDLNLTTNEQFQMLHIFTEDVFPYNPNHCVHSTKVNEVATTISESDRPLTSEHLAYLCMWVLVFLVTLMMNGCVIACIKSLSKLRDDIDNLFICSLAFSDLLVALFIIPMKASLF